MRRTKWRMPVALAVLVAAGIASAALVSGAGAASGKSATTTAPARARTPETPLTGTVLDQVKAAAIAKVGSGATVDFATTENDSSNSAAAYEAHVTKADGTHVTVILDKDYTVLSVEAGHGPGGPGGPFGHGGPPNGETPLTGDTLTSAKAAAAAAVPGGTVEIATTENDSSNSAAKYEVHVTKSDGTHVAVILDSAFKVLSIETAPLGPPHGRHP
jgi:uncharacterized membrane protein YkoI